MRTVRRAALAAVAVVLAQPSVALAADASLTVQAVETGSALLRLSVPATGDGHPVDPGTVRVTLNGQPAPADVQRLGASAAARKVVLLLDVSGSMRGPRMETARRAATVFAEQAPPSLALGLTTFSSDVRVAAAPAPDRSEVRQAIAAAQAGGRTRLHDGLIAAADQVRDGDVVLLLSDGADDGSTRSAAEATQALRRSGASFTAVDLQEDAALRAALEQLARSAGGRVVPATGPGAAASVLGAEAQRLRTELQINVPVPESLRGKRVTARVTAGGGSVAVTAQAAFDAPGPVAAAPVPPAPLWRATAQPVSPLTHATVRWALLAVFVSMTLLLWLVLGSLRGAQRDQRRMAQLLERYTVRAPSIGDTAPLAERSVVVRAVFAGAATALRRDGREQRISALLQAAGSGMQPDAWLVVRVLAVPGGALLMGVLAGLPGAVVGAVVGMALPGMWMRRRAAKRRAVFGECLPDALALIVGGLSSGYSFAQALDTVVRDGVEPMAGEVGRALAESRLGVPLEQALEAVADRMESEDLRWVVMAVGVQREVGGSLAEVLQTVFETMRDRARIKRQVRTLSAEGRVSASLLIALPIFMGLYQFLFRRDYMRPMYTEPIGLVMLAGIAVAIVLGGLWTKALVKVEV